MGIIFFDTETTGLPLNLPLDDASQPYIVQLAWIKNDIERNFIVKPEGWDIPKKASDIHGITTEIAIKKGVPLACVIGAFYSDCQDVELVVGHNVIFDCKMIAIQCAKIGFDNFISEKADFCTMHRSIKIVNLPPTEKMLAAGFNKPKNPTLQETYQYFFGKSFEGAHDALADVRACLKIFYKLQAL